MYNFFFFLWEIFCQIMLQPGQFIFLRFQSSLDPFQVKNMQTSHPAPLKMSRFYFLVQNDAQCSETNEYQFYDLYFLRYNRSKIEIFYSFG